MAEERTTLWIEEIEGKFYLTTAKWPESFVATLAWLENERNPRTSAWDGEKLSLWLENGNAIYVKGDKQPLNKSLTLHLMYGPDPGPVPGRETSPELTAANKAKVDDALAKMGELMGASTTTTVDNHGHDGSGYAIAQDIIRVGTPGVWRADGTAVYFDPATGGPPLPPPVSSLTKALMTASTPKMNLLGLTGPVPGSDEITADVLAQKIVATPGFLDTIYARFKAEQQIGQAAQAPEPIRPGMFYDSYGIGRNINTNVWAPGTFTVRASVQPQTTWTDFLTDVAAFLTTIAEASEVFATTKDLPRTVVVQDELGMAGMGRLAESVGFERGKPRNYAVRDFFAQEAAVARNLVNRAKTLQGVAPEKPEVVHVAHGDPVGRPQAIPDTDDEDDSPDAVTREDCIRAGTMGGNGEMGGAA